MKSNYEIQNGCPLLDHCATMETNGSLYNCCKTSHISFETINQLEEWKKEQKEIFSKSDWPDACYACQRDEKNSGHSLRTVSLSEYKFYDSSNQEFEINEVELAYNNLCNYGCIMCSEDSSITIAKMIDKMDKKSHIINKFIPPFFTENEGWQNRKLPDHWNRKIRTNYKYIEKQHVNENFNAIIDHLNRQDSIQKDGRHHFKFVKPKTLKLTGGEPFLIKEYIRLLNQIPPSVRIHVITNLSVFNEDMIEALKKFNDVWFTFSIDGFEYINEAIRLNSKWSKVVKNLKLIKNEFPSALKTVCPTWTNFSIFHWKPLYLWTIKNGLYHENAFWSNIITTPRYFGLEYMSDDYKEKIVEEMSEYGIDKIMEKHINTDPDVLDMEIWYNLQLVKKIGKENNFDYDELFPNVYGDFLDELKKEPVFCTPECKK